MTSVSHVTQKKTKNISSHVTQKKEKKTSVSHVPDDTNKSHNTHTGWRRCIGCRNLQVSFCKRTIDYRVLLRKEMYNDEAFYACLPPRMNDISESCHTNIHVSCHAQRAVCVCLGQVCVSARARDRSRSRPVLVLLPFPSCGSTRHARTPRSAVGQRLHAAP